MSVYNKYPFTIITGGAPDAPHASNGKHLTSISTGTLPELKDEFPAHPWKEEENTSSSQRKNQPYNDIFTDIKENFNHAWVQADNILIVMSDSNNGLIYAGYQTIDQAIAGTKELHQFNAVVVAALNTNKSFEIQCPPQEAAKYTEKWKLEKFPILAVQGFERLTSPRRQTGFPPNTI